MNIRVVPRLRSRERLHAISLALVVSTIISSAVPCSVQAQDWGKPVWSDEFKATTPNTPPDPSKWTFDTGSEGWGNNELETYCAPGSSTTTPCDSKQANAFQDGKGHLVIQALRMSASPEPAGTWTSARMKTRGLVDFQYGRIEACMKLPVGAGLWPAFWMLGSKGSWPAGGEIDIMENVPATGGAGGGLGPTVIESTLHGPSSSGKEGLYSLAKDFTFPVGSRIDDENPGCHVYGIVWSPFMVQWYVDDWRTPFFIRTASDVPAGGRWVADTPNRYYLLLNLAVGGHWPGSPNTTTPSPAPVLVDYVRVYRADKVMGPRMTASPIGVKAGTSNSASISLVSNTGTGRVYLSCSGAPENATCSIDTGNALNPAAVDFSTNGAQTAKINVSTTAKPSGNYTLTVTAYTVSGDISTVSIPLTVN